MHLIDECELAKKLGVKRSYILFMRSNGCPCYQYRGKFLYNYSAVCQWLYCFSSSSVPLL